MKLLKKSGFGVLIGIAAAFIANFTYTYILGDLWYGLEQRTYDLRYQFKYPSGLLDTYSNEKKYVNENIVIVDIDERSFSKLGPYWKWPRSYAGEVAYNLSKGNAAAVLFDIFYSSANFGKEESDKFLELIQNGGFDIPDSDRLFNYVKSRFNYDSVFVDYTERSGNVIHALKLEDTTAYQFKSDYERKTTEKWRKKMNPSSSALLIDLSGKIVNKQVLDGSFPELTSAADRVGFINVVPERDGVIRRINLLMGFNGYTYPALALQAAMRVLGVTLNDIEIDLGKHLNLGPKFRVIKDSSGLLKTSYPDVSWQMAEALLKKKDEVRSLKDGQSLTITEKIVLVKGEKGVYFDYLNGSVSYLSILDLKNITVSDLEGLPKGQPVQIGDNTGLIKEESGLYTLVELANNQNEIYDLSLSLLLQLKEITEEQLREAYSKGRITISEKFTASKIAGKVRINQCMVLRDEVLEDFLGTDKSEIDKLSNGEQLGFGPDLKIPVDERGSLLIDFQGAPKKPYQYISFYDVKAGRIPEEYYAGKVFVLGSSATALFDIVSTPLGGDYPGVEIHATVVDDLLNSKYIRTLTSGDAFLVLLLLTVLIAVFTSALRPVISIVITVLFMISYVIFTFFVFSDNSLWLEIIKPIMGIMSAFIAAMIYRYLSEEKDKKFLQSSFKQYISPELIDMMYEKKSMPELGGEEGIRTAYFTDIQGFSTFSEALGSPKKLVELLNEYLSGMTNILLSQKGTLDKYEGDAIIAFFGAPMPMADHADRAVLTAVAMQEKLLELRKKWASEGEKWPQIVKEMHMRIGINTGEIVTGNMGCEVRMNYTMMGDAVNLAARLESGAKQYGVYSMCSGETLEAVSRGTVVTRELDMIRVVGKSKPVKIFEIMGRDGEISQKTQDCIGLFSEGLEAYRKKEWDQAVNKFTKSLELEPFLNEPGVKTWPSRVFIERCEMFKAEPPEGEWDGVYTATSK